MRKLFVANLSYRMTEDDLWDFFGEVGEVATARLATDRETGRSKGFAFVEMLNEADAKIAIEQRNGQMVYGREIKIMEAKSDEDRPRTSRPYHRD